MGNKGGMCCGNNEEIKSEMSENIKILNVFKIYTKYLL